MRVILTGGSGFVGREIARQVLGRGHQARLLARPGAVHPPFDSTGELEMIQTDFARSEALAAAMRGGDAVIHLVGIISEMGLQTFEQVHSALTGTVLSAARQASVSRFLHMSALGTRPAAPSRYHRTKWEAEERVRSSGLAWTIFRPSMIYGPGDRFTNLFAGMAGWAPVLPAIGGGQNRLQPIAVSEVARAFVTALQEPRSIGQTYDLCGHERLTFREVLRTILQASGRRRPVVSVPFPVARFQAFLLEWLWPRLLRRPPPLNRDQVLMLQEDNTGDGTRADRAFGLDHEPLGEALRRQFQPRPRGGTLPAGPG